MTAVTTLLDAAAHGLLEENRAARRRRRPRGAAARTLYGQVRQQLHRNRSGTRNAAAAVLLAVTHRIAAGNGQTALGGAYSLARTTGHHHRTVQRATTALVAVDWLDVYAVGGGRTRGGRARAHVYRLGRRARGLVEELRRLVYRSGRPGYGRSAVATPDTYVSRDPAPRTRRFSTGREPPDRGGAG